MNMWNADNLQEHASLCKAIVDYKIKDEKFEILVLQTTKERAAELTVKQLELVVWAISKRLQSEFGAPMSEEGE